MNTVADHEKSEFMPSTASNKGVLIRSGLVCNGSGSTVWCKATLLDKFIPQEIESAFEIHHSSTSFRTSLSEIIWLAFWVYFKKRKLDSHATLHGGLIFQDNRFGLRIPLFKSLQIGLLGRIWLEV